MLHLSKTDRVKIPQVVLNLRTCHIRAQYEQHGLVFVMLLSAEQCGQEHCANAYDDRQQLLEGDAGADSSKQSRLSACTTDQ